MEDLKKQAEAKGVAFEEYLGTISHRGSISKHTISNLLAGKMYELVLFGIKWYGGCQETSLSLFPDLEGRPYFL